MTKIFMFQTVCFKWLVLDIPTLIVADFGF